MPSYDVTKPDDKTPNGDKTSDNDLNSKTKASDSDLKGKKTSESDLKGKKTSFNELPSSPRRRSGAPPLERQTSRDSYAARRRRLSYRRHSSFDLYHTDSIVSAVPSVHLEEIDKKQGEWSAVPWWTSYRFRLSLLCFVGFVSLYAQRVNLSIAIVSMVDHKHLSGLHPTNKTNATNSTDQTTPSGVEEDDKCGELESSLEEGEFKWSKPLQGLLLGAFFWGYLVFQVPGGRLSERFGAKRVIAIAMFPVAVFNLLSPVSARASPYFFLVLRILIGLGEGVMYPAAQALWARWAPPNERSRLIGFSYAGGQFGNAIIFPIGGYLSAYGFDGGWPSIFYVIGTFGFLWCVLWCIFADDCPDDCSGISDIEKKYINYSLGDRAKKIKRDVQTPWKEIFTSRAVWAIIIAHMCGNYGAYMLLTQIPTYMKEVLKFDIKSNGVFSMLPYLTFWFFITVSGTLADLLISRDILSVANTRKLMSSIGMFGPGSFLIATGFMECDQQSGAVAMLTIAVGLCGFHFSGYFINHGDIAPMYAGTLFGITNTAATIPGILAPYIVSAMTPDGTRAEWQSTFYVAAAIYFAGAIWYIIMGRGEVLPWSKGAEVDEEDDMGGDDEEVGFGLHEIHEKIEEEEDDDEEEEADKGAGDKLVPSVTTANSRGDNAKDV